MITASRLRDVLSYNRATGILKWRERTSNRIRIDAEAGSKRRDGFRKIVIDGRSYLAHMLCVLHATGQWPPKPVKFNNGDRSDCRWRNLRTA
jgi:hypothetical protein